MKVTLEPYSGGTYTASTDAEHISEVVELIKGLLVTSGYHPHTIDDYFNTENQWFPERGDDQEILDEMVTTKVKIIEDVGQ